MHFLKEAFCFHQTRSSKLAPSSTHFFIQILFKLILFIYEIFYLQVLLKSISANQIWWNFNMDICFNRKSAHWCWPMWRLSIFILFHINFVWMIQLKQLFLIRVNNLSTKFLSHLNIFSNNRSTASNLYQNTTVDSYYQ